MKRSLALSSYSLHPFVVSFGPAQEATNFVSRFPAFRLVSKAPAINANHAGSLDTLTDQRRNEHGFVTNITRSGNSTARNHSGDACWAVIVSVVCKRCVWRRNCEAPEGPGLHLLVEIRGKSILVRDGDTRLGTLREFNVRFSTRGLEELRET